MDTKTIGDIGERIACEYLQQQGLRLKEHNFRSKCGEIDLIMEDKVDGNVFIEVRYRSQDGFGSGVETVTRSKQRKIIRTAQHYLLENNITDDVPARFDVVGITMKGGKPDIEWIPHAFIC
tara:strand:- start:13423 stop:13785 length:363 start_codon:yes stop_codon:yes gene_type:complete